MRTPILSALAFLAFAALLTPHVAAAQAHEGVSLGDRIPSRNVRMRNVDGETKTIGQVRGERGTLVIFTCNHCPWAQAWEARIVALGNEYRGRGIGVIAINSNDPAQHTEDSFEEMQRRARAAGMHFPYVVDETSNVARAFGATKTPEAFLFDRRGRLVYHGAIDDNAHEEEHVESRFLRDALAAVVAGEAVPRAETRAIGCSIKFR